MSALRWGPTMAVAVIILVTAGYLGGRTQGRAEGFAAATAQVKASCDDPQALTKLGDAEYLCMTRAVWVNSIKAIVADFARQTGCGRREEPEGRTL